MAYASEIDIKISETPKTTDPELLPDLIDIYNALHILAQYTDQIREFVTKQPEGEPWETFPLDKIIYTPAHTDIERGQICGPAYIYKQNSTPNNNSSFHGAILGVPYPTDALVVASGGARNYGFLHPRINSAFGIATEDAAAGDLVPIALGPGVLEVPGLRAGESVFAWSSYDLPASSQGRIGYLKLRNNGSLYRLSLNPERYNDMDHMVRVGVGIAPDAMYLFPSPITVDSGFVGNISRRPPPGEQHQGG